MLNTSESFRKRFSVNPLRLRNKYIIALLLYILWIVFFDQNNLIERFQNRKELRQLQQDKEYYGRKIRENTERLRELKTSNENLEKFAREQYLLKKDNEDIFVITDR